MHKPLLAKDNLPDGSLARKYGGDVLLLGTERQVLDKHGALAATRALVLSCIANDICCSELCVVEGEI